MEYPEESGGELIKHLDVQIPFAEVLTLQGLARAPQSVFSGCAALILIQVVFLSTLLGNF